MAKGAERLSARTAQTIKEPGMHADGKGLYLRVGASGREELDLSLSQRRLAP